MKKNQRRTKRLIWRAVLLLSGTALTATVLAAESAPALFSRGNDHMRAAEYEQAAHVYESIRAQGQESANLYYNLGNAYVKQGKIGKALLNYERARRRIPQDGDLKANREFARSMLAEPIPEAKQNVLAAVIRRGASSWPLNRLVGAGVLLYWLLAGAVAAYILIQRRGAALRAGIMICSGALVVVIVAAAFTYYDERFIQTGFIIVPQTEGRFGPASEATIYFRLYEGTPVRIIQRSGEWIRIKTPDHKFGWIPGLSMEPV